MVSDTRRYIKNARRHFHREFQAVEYGWALALAVLAILGLSGCTAAHQRRAADKEVYGIIHQVEHQVFGHTNAFSIDTTYSGRKPEDISPAELIGDRLQTNQQLLTIEGALDLAVSKSRRYQAEKERLYLTALTLTGQRYEFSPQFFATSTAELDRTSDGERFGSVQSSVGLSQFLKTGGRLSAALANDILHYYTGDPRRSVISLISVNLTQPLLRGFGRNNPAVESLTQAERNVIYSVRDFSFFQDQYSLEIVSDYFGLLAQKDVIRNRYTNYLGRVQSTQRLEARAQDRERLSDVDQARQAELTAKINYVNSVADYRNSLDQFKIKLGLPVGDKVYLDDNALVEIEHNGLVPAALNPIQAFHIAVERQPQLLNEIDRFEDSKRKIRVAADRFKPDLNLIADASLQSDGPTDYTHFDPNKVAGRVGLELDLPFDRFQERNNYRASLVSFESELRNMTLALDTLRENIERGVRNLDQRRENYEIQKNALELADRRVTSSTLLQQAGRAEVRDIVEAQDAQIAAQNALTSALIDYQEARLQLMLDIGAIKTDQPKFWLKDFLPSFIPQNEAAAVQPDRASLPVVPPEETFKN